MLLCLESRPNDDGEFKKTADTIKANSVSIPQDIFETAEQLVLRSTQAIGFDGFKFCLMWKRDNRIHSVNISAMGEVAAQFLRNTIILHHGSCSLVENIYRAHEVVFWSDHLSKVDGHAIDFCSSNLGDVSRFCASVPSRSGLNDVVTSLCVFSGSSNDKVCRESLLDNLHEITAASHILTSAYARRVELYNQQRLSPNELLVFQKMVQGETIKSVARSLGKSHKTIENQIASTKRKLKARNLAEIVQKLSSPLAYIEAQFETLDLSVSHTRPTLVPAK